MFEGFFLRRGLVHLLHNQLKLYTMIKLAIKDLRTPLPKVGDRVEFQIGEEIMTDTVAYVNDRIVEGMKWDLTYLKNIVIVKPAK